MLDSICWLMRFDLVILSKCTMWVSIRWFSVRGADSGQVTLHAIRCDVLRWFDAKSDFAIRLGITTTLYTILPGDLRWCFVDTSMLNPMSWCCLDIDKLPDCSIWCLDVIWCFSVKLNRPDPKRYDCGFILRRDLMRYLDFNFRFDLVILITELNDPNQ